MVWPKLENGTTSERCGRAGWVVGWVPFLDNECGDLICIDTVGAFGGEVGQIVEFDHESDSRRLLAPSFDSWLVSWVSSLEANLWQVDDNGWTEPIDDKALDRFLKAQLPGYPKSKTAQKTRLKPKKKKKAKNPLLDLFSQRLSADEIRAAIAEGADVADRDSDGLSPLHIAMRCAGVRQAEALIEAKADVHAKDKGGATPLHYAALAHAQATAEFINVLIAAGADANATNERQQTPLFWAQTSQAVESLLLAGANPKLQANGKSFRDHIWESGDAALVRWIDERLKQNTSDSSSIQALGTE